MQVRAFGSERNETIILLHGGGLSWWNYREAAARLEEHFHVVLPVLDGHAGADRPFASIEENAAEILSFIDGNLGGSVLMIGGLSLGAQIAMEVLSQRNDVCRFALLESASAIPSKVTHALIGPAFGSTYGLISNRTFARLQFRSLHMDPPLFEDYYRDSCAIAKEDMIAFLRASTAYEPKPELWTCRASVRIAVGGKEGRKMLRSARLLHGILPGSALEIKAGLYHGEYSLNRPDEYVGDLLQWIGNEREDRYKFQSESWI